jgi:mRNA-degrading endonuclease toxin of MazEF toxin-antitoxin module
MNRGDVVLVPFPFQDRLGEKIRPAVVVQRDADNARLANTILAMITGTSRTPASPPPSSSIPLRPMEPGPV